MCDELGCFAPKLGHQLYKIFDFCLPIHLCLARLHQVTTPRGCSCSCYPLLFIVFNLCVDLTVNQGWAYKTHDSVSDG